MLFRSRRQMQSEIERISEMERQHLGRDLHDGLSQQLAGLAMSAQALRQALSRRDKRLGAKAGWLAKHAREAAETSRNLARSLYPASLQLSGLSVALKELALLVRQLFPVRCEYRGGFTRRLPDANVERQLFRIAQEAAFNAAKHSRGRQIWITLQPAGRGVVLTVADSGVGLNRRHLLATDLGLHIMHYRATLIRAVLTISRRPHGGTLITCRWQPSILTPKKVSRHEH